MSPRDPIEEVVRRLTQPEFVSAHLTTRKLDLRIEPDTNVLGDRRFTMTITTLPDREEESHENLPADRLHSLLRSTLGGERFMSAFYPFMSTQRVRPSQSSSEE